MLYPKREKGLCGFRAVACACVLAFGACYVVFVINFQPDLFTAVEQRPDELPAPFQVGDSTSEQPVMRVPAQLWDAKMSYEPKSLAPKLMPKREALISWLRSAATIQEVETLSALRSWVASTPPDQKALTLQRMGSSSGWHKCATEHELCVCNTQQIRMGAGESWLSWKFPEFLTPTEQWAVNCEVAHFGDTDPAPGVLKQCQCYGVSSPMEGAVGSLSGLAGNQYCGDACSQGKSRIYNGSPRSRSELCRRPYTHELLWSCKRLLSRVPSGPHQAQAVLDAATSEFCRDSRLQKFLDVYLDCDYAESYLRWAEDSEWLEEAFVTYIGGEINSKYEWMATNLIRSVALFSSRPIIVVVTDMAFRPPTSWIGSNVIVYKMYPGLSYPVSFNFNKIRAMIAARTKVGIQLDVDQLVAPGVDAIFPATRLQSTPSYPFPVMPVHWMSRDAKPGEMFYEYRLQMWDHPHGMRWCHAHPTWTFWALLFLGDLLLKRYVVALARPNSVASARLWALSNLVQLNVPDLLQAGGKARRLRSFSFEAWMMEDEDMLNVELWMANASKAWCKFDLEPDTFLSRFWLAKKLYADPRWYPDGVPLMFFSVHNTKRFDRTDKLLTILSRCSDPSFVLNRSRCSTNLQNLPNSCQMESIKEEEIRLQHPEEYAEDICCCLQPRQDRHIYWAGFWYGKKEEVPTRSPQSQSVRRCILI
ncbi:unnamed protein product [Effrenium voratum]|uniref:Uncharacterized protein n=1 Tax=Effrenium voratum TaxID=2562239 RepID=A0AA36J154_9DINO|nr:unnamed protein product [Effrenium voratum]